MERSFNDRAKVVRDALDKYEGGGDYDALYAFANRPGITLQGADAFAETKITGMTVDQIREFSQGKNAYGQWVKRHNIVTQPDGSKRNVLSTPMGRYQFVGTTFRDIMKRMPFDGGIGVPGDTLFDQTLQDQMFEFYIAERLGRATTMKEKRAAMRGAWDGLNRKKMKDGSMRGPTNLELNAIIKQFECSAQPLELAKEELDEDFTSPATSAEAVEMLDRKSVV